MHKLCELIIRMQPYPVQLKAICRQNPDFEKALKNTNPSRFISLGAVAISYPPGSADQVIGFFVYDYSTEPGIFKQDFIVNVGNEFKEFRIYTRFKASKKSNLIRDISHFYKEYPSYGVNSHHPSFSEIPDEIKPRALQAIALAKKLKEFGMREEISQEDYDCFDSELRKNGL